MQAWDDSLWSEDEKYFIEKRLIPQIRYYSYKSKKLQKEYYRFSISNIILLAIIPVLTMLTDVCTQCKYIVAATSATASILSSILLLRRSKDNWLDFKFTEETLKSELAQYRAKAGDYKNSELNQREEIFSIFVENCEKIMKEEHLGWHSRMLQEGDQE